MSVKVIQCQNGKRDTLIGSVSAVSCNQMAAITIGGALW